MSATRSGVLERLRNKGLSGPSLSCTSVLQMRRVDHLESALWRDAYRAEFSTQIGQSRAEFGARVGARRSRQTFPRADSAGSGWVHSPSTSWRRNCARRGPCARRPQILQRNNYSEGSHVEVAAPYSSKAPNIFAPARIVSYRKCPENAHTEYGMTYIV